MVNLLSPASGLIRLITRRGQEAPPTLDNEFDWIDDAYLYAFLFTLTVLICLSDLPNYLWRHVYYSYDMLWAIFYIAFPKTSDKLFTDEFLKTYETIPRDNAQIKKGKGRILGLVLVQGAQNSGCHLSYSRLMQRITRRMKDEKNITVVWEVNRWASFEPMEHARTNLSVSKNMNFMWLRRLIGDYVGIPVLFLYNECNLVSLNKSVTRLEERISKHFVGTTPNYEIGLCCHSLGGPVAYRFLQKNRNRKISKLLTIGSMNHYCNPQCGLGAPDNVGSAPSSPNRGRGSPTRGSFDNSGYFKRWTSTGTNEPFFPLRVPHLDMIHGNDFLAFPFYSSCKSEDMLPEPDRKHRTVWLKEHWNPLVFAHTAYYHSESFYQPVIDFLAEK